MSNLLEQSFSLYPLLQLHFPSVVLHCPLLKQLVVHSFGDSVVGSVVEFVVVVVEVGVGGNSVVEFGLSSLQPSPL